MTNLYRLSQNVAWGALILLLPITSLSVLADLTGTTSVAVASALPLLWLVVTWFIPYVLRRGSLPRQTVPFLAFLVVALLASLSAYFIDVPPFKGKSITTEMPSALLTLAIGAAFYLVVATWPRTSGRLQLTLKLINWSGAALIGWSLVQAIFIIFYNSRYPAPMGEFQLWVANRALFINRVTGLAFEPSWLAHQLNVLYLPLWLAATVMRYSAHKRRVWRLSFENILLVLALGVLLLSFSRIGMLATVLMIAYLVIPAVYRWVQGLIQGSSSRLESMGRARRAGLNAAIFVVVAGGFLVVLVGMVYGVSRFDTRLAALFETLEWDGNGIFSLANQLAFAERLLYWTTGWLIFNDFPVFGVGLGNAGFFFPDKMPPFGYALWEVSQIFNRLAHLPNVKSMWVRILAETGWVGFSVFITWLFVMWRSGKALLAEKSGLLKTIAMMGLLALIAYLIEGFSIDSFAMPYLWISMGLLTAATLVEGTIEN